VWDSSRQKHISTWPNDSFLSVTDERELPFKDIERLVFDVLKVVWGSMSRRGAPSGFRRGLDDAKTIEEQKTLVPPLRGISGGSNAAPLVN
jgi:hypothetical protein